VINYKACDMKRWWYYLVCCSDIWREWRKPKSFIKILRLPAEI